MSACRKLVQRRLMKNRHLCPARPGALSSTDWRPDQRFFLPEPTHQEGAHVTDKNFEMFDEELQVQSLREGEFSIPWSEPAEAHIRELLARSRQMPWNAAIDWLRSIHSSFVARLDREWLSDWTLLVHPSAGGNALDVGCGFGTLTLGLARRFSKVVGIDALPLRLAVAATRARARGMTHVQLVQADGRMLPLSPQNLDLVVLNGVLEWAALSTAEDPEVAQLGLLSELRRALNDGGVIAVAIENRFALETWNLTPDTHTGMLLMPLLPRWLARTIYRLRVGNRLSVQLHSRRGYRRLFRQAGFSSVRLLDVTPSYNDYDLVIDTEDAATYRFLWEHGLVRGFNAASRSIRHTASQIFPGLLGGLSYAYIVVAGSDVQTLLDATHPIWGYLGKHGISHGTHRFGCRGSSVGSFAVVVHDGENISNFVEIGSGSNCGDDDAPLPDVIRQIVATNDFTLSAQIMFEGTPLRAWARTSSRSRH